MSHGQRMYALSATTDVQTPQWFLDALNEVCHFDHDPCPLHGAVDATVPDALDYEQPWGLSNFVNPPFNNIGPFLKRASLEWEVNGNRSIVLAPLRCHTKYWRDHVMDKVSSIYLMFSGMRFPGYTLNFPMSLCLLVYGDYPVLAEEIQGIPLRRFTADVRSDETEGVLALTE